MTAALRFDRRITPARPDVAAAYLRGQIEARRFSEGTRRAVRAASVPLRPDPRPDIGIDTELLRGEIFTVYDTDQEGWSWGQAEADRYVGWLPTDALSRSEPQPMTHRVAALRSFVYPGPSIKLPPSDALSFGCLLAVSSVENGLAAVGDGFVWAGHLSPIDAAREPDFVAAAEQFLGLPYLWGGRTSLGLDCSGLVQTALGAAGIAAPRDTDMQEGALGVHIDPEGVLRRGDLVFWRGHVGLMRDPETLLHANGHTMTVWSEPLRQARTRILSTTGEAVTSVRRIGSA